MTENERIRRQLQRAVAGGAWHGPAVEELLAGVPVAAALQRPIPGAHSVWEILAHMNTWQEIAAERVAGAPAVNAPAERDWPPVGEGGEAAWRRDRRSFSAGHRRLCEQLSALPAGRLEEPVPGADYDLYTLLHGIVQHHLYHAGQIALIKRALGLVVT